jgi:tetratricopeptide (TPR) repeat protein
MLENINDVVLIEIISKSFWIIVISISIFCFKKQLGELLSTVSSFNIAGSNFKFSNKKENSKQYALLGDIFFEMLGNRNLSDNVIPYSISERSITNLSEFLHKYLNEIPFQNQEIQLLKNGALILARKQRFEQALEIYNYLLGKFKGDVDLLNLKALLLLNTNEKENVLKAEQIADFILQQSPKNPLFRFNRVLIKSFLEKFDEALSELGKIDIDYFRQKQKSFDDIFLQRLSVERETEFNKIKAKVEEQLTNKDRS